MGTLALIGLGSNLGDRKAILNAAVSSLGETSGVEVHAVSRYHETAPVGGPAGQGPFLNAAMALETTLSPFALHDRLQGIERDAGRVRVVRWGERTLDLDLLLYGDLTVETEALRIPHPRMPFRRFVLAPLAEVAPSAVDPLTHRIVAELLALLDRRPSYVAIQRPEHGPAEIEFSSLVTALGAVPVFGPQLTTGDYSDPGRRASYLSRIVEELADRLQQAFSKAGVGWVASDFWFDAYYYRAMACLEPVPKSFGAFQTRFLAARIRVPCPTIVVGVHGPGPSRPAWADRSESLAPDRKGVSILRPESSSPAALLDEVLALCESGRAGIELA